jgi:hypothetical protein
MANGLLASRGAAADANEFPQSAEAKEWIETYVALGASFLVSTEEGLLVKDSAVRAFRWERWFAKSSSRVLWLLFSRQACTRKGEEGWRQVRTASPQRRG